ncbi:MAG: BrnA antitoxin family protein [Acidovorax sp.]
MNANVRGFKADWVDPDDAPELTEEMLERGVFSVDGKQVSREESAAAFKKRMGRPPVAVKRPTLNMRIDPDVLEALKASGRGWQTRVNELLRADIKAGRLKAIS